MAFPAMERASLRSTGFDLPLVVFRLLTRNTPSIFREEFRVAAYPVASMVDLEEGPPDVFEILLPHPKLLSLH